MNGSRMMHLSLTLALFVSTSIISAQTIDLSRIPPPPVNESVRVDSLPLMNYLVTNSCGISVEPVYTGEVFTNTKGGISTNSATRYQALLDLSVTLDFEQLKTPLPGRFQFLAQNTHGEGLTESFVGDSQVFSNIDSTDNITQISEYWWEVGFESHPVQIRLGKQDINTKFLLMPSAQDFVHSGFGLSPAAEIPSYPNPSMAAVLLGELTPNWRLKAGIWDLFADGGSWGFSGNGLILGIMEVEYRYELLSANLPGTVAFGMSHSTSGIISQDRIPASATYYIQCEQFLFRESKGNHPHDEGLTVFMQYVPTFYDGENPLTTIPEDAVLGMTYRGLIPGRDRDVIGAGLAWARLDQGGTNREVAYEIFYKAAMSSSLTIQPDLQYISSPSGIYPDALVVGTRFELRY